MQTYQNGAAEHSNSAKLEVLLLEKPVLAATALCTLGEGEGAGAYVSDENKHISEEKLCDYIRGTPQIKPYCTNRTSENCSSIRCQFCSSYSKLLKKCLTLVSEAARHVS